MIFLLILLVGVSAYFGFELCVIYIYELYDEIWVIIYNIFLVAAVIFLIYMIV